MNKSKNIITELFHSEFISWKGAWYRVHNPKSKNYYGLPFDERYSFKLPDRRGLYNLISDIGAMPEDGKKYSIEKVVDKDGYVRGNIMWMELTINSGKRRVPKHYKKKSK